MSKAPTGPRYEEAIIRDLRLFKYGETVKVGKTPADQRTLEIATKLQRLLLVSVKPVNNRTARVELTPAGVIALQQHGQ